MHGLLRPANHFLAPASSAQSHFGQSPADALDASDFISAQPWFDLQLHRSHGRRCHQRSHRRPRRQVRRGKRSTLAPLYNWMARLTPRFAFVTNAAAMCRRWECLLRDRTRRRTSRQRRCVPMSRSTLADRVRPPGFGSSARMASPPSFPRLPRARFKRCVHASLALD